MKIISKSLVCWLQHDVNVNRLRPAVRCHSGVY